MAEIESEVKIIPLPPTIGTAPTLPGLPNKAYTPEPIYRLSAREFTATGESMEISCELPTTTNFNEWSVKQQVVMLKKGTWKTASVAEILWGMAYARKLNLDIMAGDVYSVGDGRIATSNKAKIKLAFATQKIKGFDVQFKELNETPASLAQCSQKKDLECTVSLDVEGLNKPIVRRAKLSAWFNPKNPNWTGRPDHMLELNTMAHACEYVHPTETGVDELPDQEAAQLNMGAASISTPSVKELRAAADAEKERRAVPADVPLAQLAEPVQAQV